MPRGRPKGSKNKNAMTADVEKLSTETVISGVAFVEEVKEPVILPLTVDFGREDLNNVANKVNEIIQYINNNAV